MNWFVLASQEWAYNDWQKMLRHAFELMPHPKLGHFQEKPVGGLAADFNTEYKSPDGKAELRINVIWYAHPYTSQIIIAGKNKENFRITQFNQLLDGNGFRQMPYEIVRRSYQLLDELEQNDDGPDSGEPDPSPVDDPQLALR